MPSRHIRGTQAIKPCRVWCPMREDYQPRQPLNVPLNLDLHQPHNAMLHKAKVVKKHYQNWYPSLQQCTTKYNIVGVYRTTRSGLMLPSSACISAWPKTQLLTLSPMPLWFPHNRGQASALITCAVHLLNPVRERCNAWLKRNLSKRWKEDEGRILWVDSQVCRS